MAFKPLGSAVSSEEGGCRLDVYLAKRFRFFSRAEWQRRIRSAEVLVDAQAAKSGTVLRGGEQIYYFHPNSREPEVDDRLEILAEKNGILAVWKPAGLPMHEGGAYRFNTFARRIQEVAGQEWAAAHRIDRETSGLVLCAKDDKVRSHLGRCFRKNLIRKQYLAIVHGVGLPERFTAEEPIGPSQSGRIRIKNWVNFETGYPSTTYFQCLESFAGHSLVLAEPKTGRTNQIRIHLAYRGWHLLGDKLFFPDEEVFLDYWEHGITPSVVERTGHVRCALHAWRAEVPDPLDGEEALSFEAPFADDLSEWLLRSYNFTLPEDLSTQISGRWMDISA
jgi:RluA family pseudouridine synthase